MASFNRVIIAGHLTRDPEVRQLPSGQSMCRLNLASNRQSKNKQTGALIQEVCFIDIDVWGQQAESCRQYLQKGRPVLIEGRLKFDTWKDAEGQMKSKHSIVSDRVIFLGSNNNSAQPEAGMSDFDELPKTESVMGASLDTSASNAAAPRARRTVKPVAETSPMMDKSEVPFDDELPF